MDTLIKSIEPGAVITFWWHDIALTRVAICGSAIAYKRLYRI